MRRRSPQKNRIDKVLDVTGLVCPATTVMATNALKEMDRGKTIQVITNDIATRKAIPSICRKEGCTLVDSREKDGLLYFIVSK